MTRLVLPFVALLVAPVAGAQGAADAQAQVERQMHANLVARGLTPADADYVVGCAIREASPTDVPCSDERIARLLGAPAADPEPGVPEVAPPSTPEAVDAPDTSTASVRMAGEPAFTFEGRAYHTVVSVDFAVLALVTFPLVDGEFEVPGDAPFSFVEVRLYEGLKVGVQSDPRGISLHHWGPGGTRVDGPTYRIEEAAVEITRFEDGIAHGTITLVAEAIDDDTRLGEGERHTLESSFRAVAGRIPPP